MGKIQDIFFYGGMNSDDSLEFIGSTAEVRGDYLYAENTDNLSIGSDNNQGSIVPVRSNVKVLNPYWVTAAITGAYTDPDAPDDYVWVFIDQTDGFKPDMTVRYVFKDSSDNILLQGSTTLIEGWESLLIMQLNVSLINWNLVAGGFVSSEPESKECIGSVSDNANNKVYAFYKEVFDNTIYRVIYEYNNITQQIENLVVKTELPIFNFDISIKWGNVIRGHLLWTQETLENPKEINIERAINFTKNQMLSEEDDDTEFTPTYSSMSVAEFDVYRIPPVTPIIPEYKFDETKITNNVRNRLFQFRYKYVYFDGSESVWSAISKVALPTNSVNNKGEFQESFVQNCIQLSFKKDNSHVKDIIVASRFITSEKTISLFETITTIDVSDNPETDLTYDFYNDIQGSVVSEQDSAKIFDAVPLFAGTQEIISSPDKLIYGNVKDAIRENIEVDVDLSIVGTDITIVDESSGLSGNLITSSQYYLAPRITDFGFGSLMRRQIRINPHGAALALNFNTSFLGNAELQSISLRFRLIYDDVEYTITTGSIDLIGLNLSQRFDAVLTAINDITGTDVAFLGWDNMKTNLSLDTATSGYYWDYPSQDALNGIIANIYKTSNTIWIRVGRLFAIKELVPFSPIRIRTGFTGLDNKFFWGAKIGREYINGASKEELSNLQLIVREYDLDNSHRDCLYEHTSNYLITQTGLSTLSETSLKQTLNPFSRRSVGIVYLDEKYRPSFVQECGDIFVDRPNDEYGDAIYYQLQMNIKHLAPTWARYWKPVVTANKTFSRFSEVDIKLVAITTPFEIVGDDLIVDFNGAILEWQDLYKNTAVAYETWQYEQGDRMLIYDTDSEEYIDKEIVGVQEDGRFILQALSLNIADLGFIIRVYRPQKSLVQDLYYEVGETYNVYKPKKKLVALNETVFVSSFFLNQQRLSLAVEPPLNLSVGNEFNIELIKDGEIVYSGTGTVLLFAVQLGGNYEIVFDTLWNTDWVDVNAGNIEYDAGGFFHSPNTPEAEITLDYGDVYLNAINYYKFKKSGETVPYTPTYNEFFLPFYPSNLNSQGRVHVSQKTIKTDFYKARLRFGNAFIQGANFMGLTSFDSLDYEDLPEKFGTIRGMYEVGYTLKVIMDTKPISIYLQRALSVDPIGEESVLLTQSTLGTVRIPENSYGTIYPDTIVRQNRQVYFLDVNNGCVVRDSANGQYPISNYKYATYLKKFCSFVKDNSDNIKIFATYLKRKEEFILSVKILDTNLVMPDNKGNAMVFTETTNRWTKHLRLEDSDGVQPEWGQAIGDDCLMFLNGDLYIQEIGDGSTMELFGNEFESLIKTVFNQEAKQIKLPLALSVQASKLWHCGEDGDVYIPENDTYGEMSSRLLPNKFKKVEGKYYTEFMKNGLSKPDYTEGVVRGQQLRGNAVILTLRTDEPNNKLFSIGVNYITSDRGY